MNFILNEKKIDKDNIILINKKHKINIFYQLNDIKIYGIPLLISKNNIKYIDKNNISKIYFDNNDVLFLKLKMIDNYFKDILNNYYSFIKNNSIQIKLKKKI